MILTCVCGGMYATERDEGIACSPSALCHCGNPRQRPNTSPHNLIIPREGPHGIDYWTFHREAEGLLADLKEIENHCPCGARPESPNTHPHVIGCPVERALRRVEQLCVTANITKHSVPDANDAGEAPGKPK